MVIFSLTIAFLYGSAVSMKLALGRRPTILFTYALLIIFFTSMWHPKLHHWDLRQHKGVKTFLNHFKLLCVVISIMISFQPSRDARRAIKCVSTHSFIFTFPYMGIWLRFEISVQFLKQIKIANLFHIYSFVTSVASTPKLVDRKCTFVNS